MWLCAGKYVTTNSEIKKPAPLSSLVQGGANPPVNGAGVWSGDGTDCAMVWLNIRDVGAAGGETTGWEK